MLRKTKTQRKGYMNIDGQKGGNIETVSQKEGDIETEIGLKIDRKIET